MVCLDQQHQLHHILLSLHLMKYYLDHRVWRWGLKVRRYLLWNMWVRMWVALNLTWPWWGRWLWNCCGNCYWWRKALGWPGLFPCCSPVCVGVGWYQRLTPRGRLFISLVVSLMTCKFVWVNINFIYRRIPGKIRCAVMCFRLPRYFWCVGMWILEQGRCLWRQKVEYRQCGVSHSFNPTNDRCLRWCIGWSFGDEGHWSVWRCLWGQGEKVRRQPGVELPGGTSCWDGLNLKPLAFVKIPGGVKVGNYGYSEEVGKQHRYIGHL